VPATATDAVSLARLLPPPRHAHPATDPAVVFVHEDTEDTAGAASVVFAFNLTAEHLRVRRVVRGQEVCVELAPRGAACRWWAGDAFAAATGTAGLELLPPPPVAAFPSGPIDIEETLWT
jgi:hypothetical protein